MTQTQNSKTSEKNGSGLSGKAIAGAVGVAAVTGVGLAMLKSRRSDNGSKGKTRLEVRSNGDGWGVFEAGESSPLQTFELKGEAVDAARVLAHDKAPSELSIQREDGSEQARHSYDQ